MMPFRRCALLFVVSVFAARSLPAYSVLSHEALVDALWDIRLRPFLLQAYPSATPDDLKRAHGYAYGGAILQDLGYYPHASAEFSDLTHYVRTGDFIQALLLEAHDVNELAFALGALSHYVSDIEGHREATNVGEPILYPKLAKKFGNVVTYEDDPAAHLKTEFGFDVLEVARGNFAPETYHDFIGFYVAKDLIGHAFQDTYGLHLSDLFSNFDFAVSAYRSAVSKTIPLATRVAWAQKKKEIQKAEPGVTHRRFIYNMRRSSYEREWGKRLQQPNWFERVLAVFFKLIPPIGPLKALQLKIPTPPVEQLFMASFNRSTNQFGQSLDAVQHKDLVLPDRNYDTGDMTPAGKYRLNDQTQIFWLNKLADKNFVGVTPAIKQELLTFFTNPDAVTYKTPDQRPNVLKQLTLLKQTNPVARD